MHLTWFGQSAFLIEAADATVSIDPHRPMPAESKLSWAYPPMPRHSADLLLVTHEHFDHTGVDAVDAPQTIRSTAGTFEDTAAGTVVAVAAEHDDRAGTGRGPSSIFKLTLGGVSICHFGDFGQRRLRPEQRAALGEVDLLLVPVGGGPTIGVEAAIELIGELDPAFVVPMHYRNDAAGFLAESADELIAHFDADRVTRFDDSRIEVPAADGAARLLVPAVPLAA